MSKKQKKRPKQKHKKPRRHIPKRKIMRTSSGEPPLVENGFRWVGPAQAMMDYSQHLFDKFEVELGSEIGDIFLRISQVCWNIAICDDPSIRQELKRTFLESMPKEFKILDWGKIVDEMVEHHHHMFPYIKKDRGFYIRERVPEPPEDVQLFDGSELQLAPEPIAPDRSEKRLVEALKKIDALVAEGADWGEYEKKFQKTQDGLIEKFKIWCITKGVPSETTGNCGFAAHRYMDYVYGYTGATLSTIPPDAIGEFMVNFWLRKTFSDPFSLSHMPKGLELFYQFLVEKEYLADASGLQKIIEKTKPRFLKNLKAYFGFKA